MIKRYWQISAQRLAQFRREIAKLGHWRLSVLFLLLVWLDYFWPLDSKLVHRAEPVSLTAIFISLAFSAASFAVQRIFGPKPPTVTRGKMEGELFIQNASEGTGIPEIYGGTSSASVQNVTWQNLTRAFVNSDGNLENDNTGSDNCFTDASGTGDSGARSVQVITAGDFEVSWTFGPNPGPSGRSFLGLYNGFSLNFADWRYTIHVSTESNTSGTPHPANSIFIYQGSPPNLAFLDAAWDEGDTLRIRCVGGVVTYWHKDTLIYTSALAPTYPLYINASMACHDSTVENITLTTTPDAEGGIRTAGTIIWAKPPRKVTTKEKKGGKGAPKQTVETITYYTDLAILFGRGRLGIKKLEANADTIIDLNAPVGSATGIVDPGSSNTNPYLQDILIGVAFNDADRIRAAISNFYGLRLHEDENGVLSGTIGAAGGASFRFYEGNYDQLPDSLIQADINGKLGAGSTPAYRGLSYLVIENFNISKYGGIPTFLATLFHKEISDVQELADHLCERSGIEPGDRDFDVLASDSLRGLIVQEPQPARQTLDMALVPTPDIFYESIEGLLTATRKGTSPTTSSLRFDSAADYYSGDLPPFPNTIMCWIYIPADINLRTMLICYNTGGVWEIGTLDGTRLEFDGTLGTNLQLNTWYHLAVVSAAGSAALRQIYLNGVLDFQRTADQPTPVTFNIGAASGGDTHYDGRMAALKIWSAALTQSEIQAEMELYAPVRTAGLFAQYSLQSNGTTIPDESGNGHNLTAFSLGGSLEDGPPIFGPGVAGLLIDTKDLGMQEGDESSLNGQMGTEDEVRLIDPVQLPREIAITAFDPGKGLETTTQRAYLQNAQAEGIEPISLPMTLTPDEARRAAERILYERWIARDQDAIKLPWRYGYLNPTDIVRVSKNNITTRYRINQVRGALPGLQEFALVADESAVYLQTIAGDGGGGWTPPTVSVPVQSIAMLIDSVTLRDQDDAAGYYAAIVPRSSAAGWSGAVLHKDRGSGYEVVERFTAPATAGVLVSAVTSQDPAVWDEVTVITIDLYGTDPTLESLTEAEVLNGGNAACLGANQIIQFQNATKLGGFDNRWELSRILWGRRGSDHSAGTFAIGSRFILLDGAVLFIANSLTEKGIARDFKAVTAGYSIDDTAATSFTWDANILKPLSVVDIQGTRDGSNNLTITWVRRSRIGHETPYAGSDLPLGEEFERYELDIWNGLAVVRTITVNDATTASYTAAEQTTDGLTPGNPVTVRVYQISATVGRGFVREVTI